ncbi:MAG: hypothetical protein QOF51_44, partial [Chloroflexota bacterium]|nr:hypothetical protein [Chloroflexota bacterium]
MVTQVAVTERRPGLESWLTTALAATIALLPAVSVQLA